MHITNIKFIGLPGFNDLSIHEINHITSFIGPNGSGKSSILKSIKYLLDTLEIQTASAQKPKDDARFIPSFAFIELTSPTPLIAGFINENNQFNKISFSITYEKTLFHITAFSLENITYQVSSAVSQEKIRSLQTEISQIKQSILTLESRVNLQESNEVKRNNQNQLNNHRSNLPNLEKDLEKMLQIKIATQNTDKSFTISRVLFDEWITSLKIPSSLYIPPRQAPDVAITELISELMNLKKARRNQYIQYAEAIERLSLLLQATVDVSEINQDQDLHINGVSYKNASSGTETSLAYFGLTKLSAPNKLILWDEPENGLHPTRRSKLLELMTEDLRQVILATHASEFAPVFQSTGKVIHCKSTYSSDTDVMQLSISPIASKRDAFILLDAMGVSPANTLFTANVVIWVEGPTELLFYRYWLKNSLPKDIIEGFHYTFMQYGGSLISYLSLADDNHIKSVFDLLSINRNPIILVDSDIKQDIDESEIPENLKSGARRLLQEVTELNSNHPGSAAFLWTHGREIENYLPISAIIHAVSNVWNGYEENKDFFSSEKINIGRYDSVFDQLFKFFTDQNIIDSSGKPKGRTLWGESNKVEMMKHALSLPSITLEDLRWNGKDQITRIAEYIKDHSIK